MKLFSVKIFIMKSDVIEEIKKPKIYHQRVRRRFSLSKKHWKMAILRER